MQDVKHFGTVVRLDRSDVVDATDIDKYDLFSVHSNYLLDSVSEFTKRAYEHTGSRYKDAICYSK